MLFILIVRAVCLNSIRYLLLDASVFRLLFTARRNKLIKNLKDHVSTSQRMFVLVHQEFCYHHCSSLRNHSHLDRASKMAQIMPSIKYPQMATWTLNYFIYGLIDYSILRRHTFQSPLCSYLMVMGAKLTSK